MCGVVRSVRNCDGERNRFEQRLEANAGNADAREVEADGGVRHKAKGVRRCPSCGTGARGDGAPAVDGWRRWIVTWSGVQVRTFIYAGRRVGGSTGRAFGAVISRTPR